MNNCYSTKEVREVPLQQVQIHDEFWSKLQEKIIDIVLPFQERVLNDQVPGVAKSHAIENFRIAAGLSQGEFYGMVFQDSDVAKWLEGVAYALTAKPDTELEARADEVIDIIEKAQQPDGYLDTYFIIKEPEHRWQNLQECHELYCAGHLMEAAAAYYQATGKDSLLHAAQRLADHIVNRFGEGKERGIPGHQEIEIGLIKLYRITGNTAYKELARFFLEERGKNPDYFYEEKARRGWQHWGAYRLEPVNMHYYQAHETIYEQREAVGHAVRAAYMYTAMADLAGEDGDQRLYNACRTLWDSIVQQKMYLTGGIGATVDGEAFSAPFELPNDTAYAETCASIAMVFFARRMLEAEPLGEYADIMERELYNGVLSGMGMDGTSYFYVNPLEVVPGVSGQLFGYRHDLPQRPGWYECACCPTNLVRLVTSLGSYAWSESADAIYSHLLLGQRADLEKAEIIVESDYPRKGRVFYQINPKTDTPFTLAVHLPAFVSLESPDTQVLINGVPVNTADCLRNGYLYLTRVWQAGDEIRILFDIPVRRLYANPRVRANAGCTAFMRGPVVYCFEGADNGEILQALRIPRDAEVETFVWEDGVLAGNICLRVNGWRLKDRDGLYSNEPPEQKRVQLTAVPYYAWANRGEHSMRVWMLES